MSNEKQTVSTNERDAAGKNPTNRPADTTQPSGQQPQGGSPRNEKESAQHGSSDNKGSQQSQGAQKDSGGMKQGGAAKEDATAKPGSSIGQKDGSSK